MLLLRVPCPVGSPGLWVVVAAQGPEVGEVRQALATPSQSAHATAKRTGQVARTYRMTAVGLDVWAML